MSDTTQSLACSLDAQDAARQAAGWSELAGHGVTRREVSGGYEVVFPLALAETVEELAERESGCCGSWMAIETERGEAGIRLRVTSGTPEALPLIEATLVP